MNIAKLEKNLAQTDLNQFKTEPLKQLIKQIYKYQNFKTRVILEKINRGAYSENTVALYIDKIRQYIRFGTKNTHTGTQIYEIVDELKANHTPILTPSESDKARVCNRKSKHVTNPSPTPVQKTPVEPPKYIEKIPPQYGIKCGDWIRLQPTKEMALGYIECYKVIGDGKPVELVTVDLEVES